MNDEDPELIAMKRAHGKYDPPKKPTSRPPMPNDPATVAQAECTIANPCEECRRFLERKGSHLASLAAGPPPEVPPEVQSVAAALENARLRAELAAAVEAGIELGFDCRHGQTSGGLTILGLIQEMGSQIAAARAEIEKCHGIIAKRIEAKDDELAEAKAEIERLRNVKQLTTNYDLPYMPSD